MSKNDYKVTFTVISNHSYRVPECNSPEEAESIAEEWFADGEEGVVDSTDIEDVDVIEDRGEED